MACFGDLPHDCLPEILRYCKPRELASLSVQSRLLRELASEEALWEAGCKERWSNCRLREEYATWAELYRTRAGLPDFFCRSVDTMDALQQLAADSPMLSINIFGRCMQAIYSIGIQTQLHPELKRTPDFRVLRKLLTWWISKQPSAVLTFARATNAALQDFDPYMGTFVNWDDCPWRRSALAFLVGMLECVAPWENPGLLANLGREIAALDSTLRSVEEEASGLAVHVPKGIPVSHWWFRLSGCSSTTVC